MKPLRCLIGLHDWEVTPAVYDSWVAQLLAQATQEATRSCRCCSKTQFEDRQCLGLTPPRYDSSWYTVPSPKPSSPG